MAERSAGPPRELGREGPDVAGAGVEGRVAVSLNLPRRETPSAEESN